MQLHVCTSITCPSQLMHSLSNHKWIISIYRQGWATVRLRPFWVGYCPVSYCPVGYCPPFGRLAHMLTELRRCSKILRIWVLFNDKNVGIFCWAELEWKSGSACCGFWKLLSCNHRQQHSAPTPPGLSDFISYGSSATLELCCSLCVMAQRGQAVSDLFLRFPFCVHCRTSRKRMASKKIKSH